METVSAIDTWPDLVEKDLMLHGSSQLTPLPLPKETSHRFSATEVSCIAKTSSHPSSLRKGQCTTSTEHES
jgi:hypothetical protein